MKNLLLSLIIGFGFINFPLFQTIVLAQDNEINNLLKDTIYYLPDGKAITLSGGRYKTENKVFVLSEKVAIADINNDQLADFFVIVTELTQGIQLNNYIAVLLGNNDQQLDNVDTLFIDNEIDIENLSWTDQVLTVEFMANSPERKKKLKYHFDLGSETLIPLTLETEKKPGDIFIRDREQNIIEPDFNNSDEDPSIQIEL
ncbi:hypothetical protein [Crocosphaera chwakensis]|uniref:Uncharacterized protein n=1 Tax=Crocosphaera chwakensis CCY0110 TaxID=391612 RepID=A3IUB0_9CHRO|nr:hypothetical protein [Crocosphaera chwakensis]EAZ89891.1 hypothetical protein CY0110_13883 [Crocosphaera chwakensis CCY0110]